MKATLKSGQAGQAIVLVVAVMTVVIGMAALVVDGGSWRRAQRHLQTAADAGALAGAQNLPTDQAGARSTAVSYAQQNYSGIPAPTITFPDSGTIDVAAQTTAPGFLAKIYGSVFNTVTVRSRVDGQIEKVGFDEGQMVREGDLLVQIDPAPFQAVSDHQGVPRPGCLDRGLEEGPGGLADHGGGGPRGRGDGRQECPRTGPQAVRHRVRRVATGCEEVCAAAQGEHGVAQVIVRDLVGPADHQC